MDGLTHLTNLVLRQDEPTIVVPLAGTAGHCIEGNDFDGRIGLRVSSIFFILVGSTLGAWFPVFAKRHQGVKLPEWAYFFAKFFGSGVIVATAFIHLLAPAVQALSDPCLTGPITDYSWPEAIALVTIFSIFFAELMTMRFATFGSDHHTSDPESHAFSANAPDSLVNADKPDLDADTPSSVARGVDHLGHARDHHHDSTASPHQQGRGGSMADSYAAKMTAIFILEFGIIFHSLFIGLTLAVSGSEFSTLFVVLVFHQTFEGLGLGSRLAATPWPETSRWTPYFMALGYGLSTPIAIAIGLGVRNSYAPSSQTALIVNGVFDSISSGILIYTGLVELMAHEFMFSHTMQTAKIGTVMSAFGLMCMGAALMAVLGKWA